ncbi:MAG: hypothetical protein GX590_03280, partial [Lentisphaerae bacterium]|nr:hypothetical protein [Lentisphaerota bacterium]
MTRAMQTRLLLFCFALPLVGLLPTALQASTAQPAAQAAADAPVWSNRLTLVEAEMLGDFPIRWDARGILLRLSDPAGGRALVCTVKRRRSVCLPREADGFGTNFIRGLQVTAMLRNTNVVATLALRRSQQRCTVYVDGQPALSFADVWEGPLVLATPAQAVPAEAGEGFTQRLAPFRFQDDFLVDK